MDLLLIWFRRINNLDNTVTSEFDFFSNFFSEFVATVKPIEVEHYKGEYADHIANHIHHLACLIVRTARWEISYCGLSEIIVDRNSQIG